MAGRTADVDSILLTAIQIDSQERRLAYLDKVCRDDQELREHIERLIRAHLRAGDFLEAPACGDCPTDASRGLSDTDNSHQAPSDSSVPDNSLGSFSLAQMLNNLQHLGPYEVLDVIGRGGMGVVIRAHDPKLNRMVAIKVLAPELRVNEEACRRFLREARAAAGINHPHVVTIHGVEEADDIPYLVMEYIDGQSLREKIDREGVLPADEVLRIGSQIAAGLAAAHDRGLIHRDIKPANILLENSVERVKITDFGLARAADDISITGIGQIAGTPEFMSPEQAQGVAVEHRSDLFSLGSVLYTMCTGSSPFRAETTVAVLRRVCDDEPRPIQELNPEVPDWLVEIVDGLLAKDPDDRFRTAEEVAELLNTYAADPSQSGKSLPAGLVSRNSRNTSQTKGMRSGLWRRRRPWFVAGLLLLSLIVLGAAESTGVTQLRAWLAQFVLGEEQAVKPAPVKPAPVYVNVGASGANTGSSWEDAYTSLQKTLAVARAGQEIWVAKGTYTPTDGEARTVAFHLKAGVEIYGGFSGTESDRDTRDWLTHPTILSGDLKGNDRDGDKSDNSFHVVYALNVPDARLDGVTITAGNADGDYPEHLGAGFYNDKSSITLANVVFMGNSAKSGGGMYNYGGSTTLTNVTFTGNTAEENGGGLYNFASSPVLTDVTFRDNSAVGRSGGMENRNGDPTLKNVRFINNSAKSGGALFCFEGNATLTNVAFSGNSAYSGGGMRCESDRSKLVNVTFRGNTANYGGGFRSYNSLPELINTTFCGNQADARGGAMYNSHASVVSLTNSILWGNTAPDAKEIHDEPETLTHVSYCLVEGGWDGEGNIDSSPLFVRPTNAGPDGTMGTPDDDYGDLRLQSESPCIDTGKYDALPLDSVDLDGDGVTEERTPFDLALKPRKVGARVDMGAYECRQ